MCTVTSRRVGCGCTVWSFTTLGERGLSLSLGRQSPKVRILELGCKRLREISLNFCMNVRGSKCNPKSYINRDENTRSGYHVDLEFSDRSRE